VKYQTGAGEGPTKNQDEIVVLLQLDKKIVSADSA
jgi:hypothetical protein